MKLIILALLTFSFIGCWRPYDVPEFHEVGNSHTAFLVPLEGDAEKQEGFDSEELLEKNMVSIKRVQIPHLWVQTGRWRTTGHWAPSVRLITVDRAPVTRQLATDGTAGKGQAIWVESYDSVGFSTGISITAHIPNDQAAVKFLYKYPSAASMKAVKGQEGSFTLEDTGNGLATVLETEVRAQIQSRMATFAGIYKMDRLRERKNEMLTYVKHGELPPEVVIVKKDGKKVLPEGIPVDELVYLPETAVQVGVLEFFEQRGIEITELGQFGGFTYENTKIQAAIDNVFAAQQDEEVAKAETKAQLERNKSIEEAAKGKARAAEAQAEGEAKAIRTIADAKSYEIEKANQDLETYLKLKSLEIEKAKLEKWNGILPQWNFTGGGNTSVPSVILEMPENKK